MDCIDRRGTKVNHWRKWPRNDWEVKPCGGKRHNSEGGRLPGDSCPGNRGTDAGDSEGWWYFESLTGKHVNVFSSLRPHKVTSSERTESVSASVLQMPAAPKGSQSDTAAQKVHKLNRGARSLQRMQDQPVAEYQPTSAYTFKMPFLVIAGQQCLILMILDDDFIACKKNRCYRCI